MINNEIKRKCQAPHEGPDEITDVFTNGTVRIQKGIRRKLLCAMLCVPSSTRRLFSSMYKSKRVKCRCCMRQSSLLLWSFHHIVKLDCI